MRKTIEQILLDSLKDKHATVYYGNSDVYNFSGFVRDVKVQINWDYTSVILSVDTGMSLYGENGKNGVIKVVTKNIVVPISKA